MLLVLDVLTFDLFLRSPNFMTSMEYPLIFMHIWRVFRLLQVLHIFFCTLYEIDLTQSTKSYKLLQLD